MALKKRRAGPPHKNKRNHQQNHPKQNGDSENNQQGEDQSNTDGDRPLVASAPSTSDDHHLAGSSSDVKLGCSSGAPGVGAVTVSLANGSDQEGDLEGGEAPHGSSVAASSYSSDESRPPGPTAAQTSPSDPTRSARLGQRARRHSQSRPTSLGARFFVSALNPHNLPALLLALLAQVYQAILNMAISTGLGRLWGRPAILGGGDGDVDMVNMGEGSGSGGAGKEVKKVKRRKKGPSGQPSHYPGMVNLSGTLCYMNSVLQALASVSSLINHLDRIYALAEQVDEPSMVSDALADVLRILNTAHSRPPSAIRPNDLLIALYELPAIRRLLSTREQQDAHELFMVLAEAVGNESVRVAKVVARSKGLGEVVSLQGYAASNGVQEPSRQVNKWKGTQKEEKVRGLAQPWEGLMARKRTCQVCGWSEGVRMDSLGGMELSLPQYGDVSLESCIAQYLAPEHLSDVTCEMCSLKRTHLHYAAEVERLSMPSGSGSSSRSASQPRSHASSGSGSFAALNGLSTSTSAPSDDNGGRGEMSESRKRRAKEAKKVEVRLARMSESGSVTHFGESPLPGPPDSIPLPIKWQTSRTPSVREGLVTRPPHVLRLHLIRSEYTPYGQLLKKTARVAFPLVLDLTPLVSRGVWDGQKGVLGALQNGQVQAQVQSQKRVLYRLSSVILHYGYTHSSGHYVCIRRKPVPATSPSIAGSTLGANGYLHTDAPAAATGNSSSETSTRSDVPSVGAKQCPDGCRCEDCMYFGQARELDAVPGRGWLRISDADVEEVGMEALVEARAQVSMLFYELVGDYAGADRPLESHGATGGVERAVEEEQGQARDGP